MKFKIFYNIDNDRPVDSWIKSRIQADLPEKRNYPTSISVLRKTLNEDGHRVLWKGLGPCLLRSIPVCAILFTIQTMTSDFLRDSSKPTYFTKSYKSE